MFPLPRSILALSLVSRCLPWAQGSGGETVPAILLLRYLRGVPLAIQDRAVPARPSADGTAGRGDRRGTVRTRLVRPKAKPGSAVSSVVREVTPGLQGETGQFLPPNAQSSGTYEEEIVL